MNGMRPPVNLEAAFLAYSVNFQESHEDHISTARKSNSPSGKEPFQPCPQRTGWPADRSVSFTSWILSWPK